MPIPHRCGSVADDPHRLVSAPVVVGVDGSEAGRQAVRWAAELAARRRRELLIVCGMNLDTARAIMAGYELMLPKIVEDVHHRAAEAVVTARKLAKQVDPALRVSTEVSADNPARLLIERAATAYLVVVGSPGIHSGIAHFGSTLGAVTRHAGGRVVVVRDTGGERQIRERGPVVVGVDGSPWGEAAIAAAFEEAAEREADLVAVHAWSDLPFGELFGRHRVDPLPAEMEQAELEVLAERLAGWQEKYPEVSVLRKVYLAGPIGDLLEWSKSAQLLVVGNRGRGGFSRMLLGSTANTLVQHAHCPVMLAHSDFPDVAGEENR